MTNWTELKRLCSKREESAFAKEVMNGTILALIAENERLRADGNDVFGLAQARADTIDQLRTEVEALRRQVETLTEWYANGLNEIHRLRNLLSAAISLDHHDSITDRTYPLRRDIDAALGRDLA